MERPGVGLAVIVMKDSKVLLGKRKNSHGEGKWAFPGGHVEKFEELSDTAMRELEEETGFTKENVDLIDQYSVTATNDFFREMNGLKNAQN